MSLRPLRFKDTQSLNDFLINLQQSGLITIEKTDDNENKQKITISSDFNDQFLNGNDDNIYFLKDVQRHIAEASDDELNRATLKFINIEKRQWVSLVQLKHDSALYDSLQLSVYPAALIPKLNFALYASTPFPPLDTLDAIRNAKILYNNVLFDRALALSNSFLDIGLSVLEMYNSILSDSEHEIGIVPILASSSEYITQVNKDITQITLIETIKLKSYLLNQMNLLKDQQLIDELKDWVNAIEESSSNIKKLQHGLIKLIKGHNTNIQKAKNKFQRIKQDDPELEKIHQKEADLNSQIQAKEKELELIEARYKILKPIAVYGLLIGLPVLVFAATVLTLAMLLPVVYLSFALAALMMPCILIQFGVFGESIDEELEKLKNGIENKFDERLEPQYAELRQLKNEVTYLEHDRNFVADFEKVEKKMDYAMAAYEPLIHELESDVQEIAEIETRENLKNGKNRSETTKASEAGIFKLAKETLSSVDQQLVDQQNEKESPRLFA